MLIIVTSPDGVLKDGKPYSELVQVLIKAREAKNPVALISNHQEPEWFKEAFGQSAVQFVQSSGRQSGQILSENAANFSLNTYDVLVLAAKEEDVQMGKNGKAVLVAAGWSQAKDLGIRIDSAAQFQEVIDLTVGWNGDWWFRGDEARYSVRALADLSGYGKPTTQQ